MFFREGDAAGLATLKAAYDRLIRRAIAMGGTATGEHGVGLGKRGYLELEHGEALQVMRRVKQALDPGNLLNPGKNAGP
jgi:D-lactate dehydrogenase (cytochrome)